MAGGLGSKIVGNGKRLSDVMKRTAISATVGGTISKAVGGKFANGAVSAAFTHLFNAEAGRGCGGRPCGNRGGGKSLWEQLTGWHFEGRAALNGAHPSYEEVGRRDSGWTLLTPEQSIFHDNGSGHPELKYIHSDGREAVFTMDFTGQYEPYLDPRYMPTYNYVNPVPNTVLFEPFGAVEYMFGNTGHLLLDVAPYGVGGNVRGKN